ncbi:MAG: DNA gyrase subunit A [Turicibacter sp.]|nr:DNA gyrase subunit A [Turicibacter sp.]
MDKIIGVDITKQMKDSYIEYAMSVIVARALPDVRDGLKPVQRRILHSMNEMNLTPSSGHKKSARIVGDTMGKYHPHGDSAIYDAMVRMAQDFSMRCPLVDGHGNFGSMDGDGAAASRYTEARLSRLSLELLAGIDQDTVDFQFTYDGEFKEPVVLPARFPNLLVNGSSGIAVGMATNIPPHNLQDCIKAVIQVIDDRLDGTDTDAEVLIDIIKAPDFPTGGGILGTAGIRQAYLTGKGKGVLRAEAEIMPMGANREMIVVTQIPYQVNKAKLVERMADLVKDKKIDGITDIRDESNRKGVRIVIELRRDANAQVILNQLYTFSPLQENFSILMLALDRNRPKVMNLKEILNFYIEHQKEVLTRRTTFELNKAERRAHILDGYLKALANIDEILEKIRASADTVAARTVLVEEHAFTVEQATAILEMRFRALTGLEKSRLEKERDELRQLIGYLSGILNDENRLYNMMKEELTVTMQRYGSERRTALLHDPGEILTEDLIDEEETVITMSHLNYVKRMSLDTYRSQRRGGKGVIGMQTREEDAVRDLIVANTHDYILFFTNYGRVHRIRAYEIPEATRTARGMAMVNLLNLTDGESVAAVIPIAKETANTGFITLVTKKGIIKKTNMEQYANIRKTGLNAITIKEDDALISAMRSMGGQSIILAAASGLGIMFNEDDVRPMGRTASGVIAMRLNPNDSIVGATIVEEGGNILLVSAGGFGKCTEISDFRFQKRGGKGSKIYRTTEKTGSLIGITSVRETDELMLINSEGIIIRTPISAISVQGRVTLGVKLIQLDNGTNVVGMAKITDIA